MRRVFGSRNPRGTLASHGLVSAIILPFVRLRRLARPELARIRALIAAGESGPRTPVQQQRPPVSADKFPLLTVVGKLVAPPGESPAIVERRQPSVACAPACCRRFALRLRFHR